MDTADTLILQEVLFDASYSFRVHNVKLGTLEAIHDLPQMFLAHYDQLDDDLKASTPLTPHLLKNLNTPMTTDEAITLLGLPPKSIAEPWHIKLGGTVVIACDTLSLAVHVNFTNTAKSHQTVYGDKQTLIKQEAEHWQLAGNVNVLFKNPAHDLVSVDLEDDRLVIETHGSYVRLPNSHALATTHAINTLKNTHPDALDYLHQAIIEKVTASAI
ncbi:hypothetical protein [Moraxella catarrhalis]|uniref:Uncharacterized protein n=1 Tax=Moraxella catarrhalis TaxID=480 RepID=A0A198UQ83_MORCA|nr:hypothetical protein [Moraxella catarrhalis]OAU97115.1 hypothetical protein AO383_1228 [Moraxella catarrhalis]OAU98485.1 hypothetical protein AO384_0069 [Moraxella catarrhalis]OAV03434.1 hypothetical protein AO385_0512 [Moraxella catarrhalis]